MIVPTPDLVIITSSALVGTAPVSQLLLSPQLRLPALPVQETAAGARRSSRASRKAWTDRRLFRPGCRARGARAAGRWDFRPRSQDRTPMELPPAVKRTTSAAAPLHREHGTGPATLLTGAQRWSSQPIVSVLEIKAF